MIILIIMMILLLLVVWLVGYMGFANISPALMPKDWQIRIACVGDSITYGMLVKNWYRNNYPRVLGRMLGRQYQVRNYGQNGRTGMEISHKPYPGEKCWRESLRYQPDIVFIMFGTNDSKPVNAWISKEEFKRQYQKLIRSYQELPSKPEIYLMTPATPFYVNGKSEGNMEYDIRHPQIHEVCEVVREIGEEWQLKTIDIHEITDGHPDWFAFDGIHTNAEGAYHIAEAVYQRMGKTMK